MRNALKQVLFHHVAMTTDVFDRDPKGRLWRLPRITGPLIAAPKPRFAKTTCQRKVLQVTVVAKALLKLRFVNFIIFNFPIWCFERVEEQLVGNRAFFAFFKIQYCQSFHQASVWPKSPLAQCSTARLSHMASDPGSHLTRQVYSGLPSCNFISRSSLFLIFGHLVALLQNAERNLVEHTIQSSLSLDEFVRLDEPLLASHHPFDDR